MKKCQTERDLVSNGNNSKSKKRRLIISKNIKTLISQIPKIPKILLNIPLNDSNISDKKFQKRINTNILTNESFTLSNLENTNPNYIFYGLSNSYRTRIYQKKKVPIPQKLSESKEEINKNNSLTLKKSFNKKSFGYHVKNFKSFKNSLNNNKIINTETQSQKYLLNDSRIANKMKKYLHSNLLLDKKNTSLNEGVKKGRDIKTDRYKRININNININLNNINKITNKIEIKEINGNLNTSRSNNSKINDIHFLKKLNFDQPKKNKIANFKTIINNNKNHSNEILFNNQNKILKRIKHRQNFIYKNTEHKIKNKISKNKISLNKPKIKNPLILINKSKKKSKSFKKSLCITNPTNIKNNVSNSNKNITLNYINNNIKNQKLDNLDTNLITSESLTILDNSISDINSFIMESKDLSKSESEKDEKHTVVSTHQLNLYLNKAKKNNSNKKGKIIFREKKSEFKKILFSSINTNFKLLLIKFLDKKSLLILSSLNKNFYINFRKKIYKYFYDKIIKNNGNRDYIFKILSSIQKYASKNLKSNNSNSLKTKYENYKRTKSKYDIIILQDISRTFPTEPNFSINSINYKKLYNILTAYSNFNKNIGYAQGLNFLAARSIILFKNEEKIFLFLDGLINRFNLDYFLSINNQRLPKQIKYFSQILNKYCKNFINYLKSKLINHDFFTTSWLLTLFSNSMDKKKIYICWCFMIIFGWKFFYSFIIQLILFYEKSLMKINEGNLSKQMKELLKSNDFIKNFNTITQNTLTFMENNIIL